MKLIYRITSRISIVLLLVMAAWTALFYFIIIDEINDETDDSLEDYSEFIITRALLGEPLPTKDNGSNNNYYLTEVTTEYARQNPAIRYYDEMVYIYSKKETEPARILKTIFMDSEDRFYELTVSIPTIEKQDLQKTILFWIVFLYILLLIAIIGVNAMVLYFNFKPLYQLLKWLNDFSVEKEFSAPDIKTKTTEFKKLNEAVIQSSYRNVEVYEQQKSFVGNASHELQTPLAICLNRLEVLANDSELNEKQLKEVLKTKQSVDYAIKLNKTLLLLTKIENQQITDKTHININALIKNLLEDYNEVYGNRLIKTSIEEKHQLSFSMNETLSSVLFGNLLKNAFLHNYIGGEIDIQISKKNILISNSGIETSLDEERIFDRFYQGTKKEGSTGLGLALCQSICKLYGIKITYRFKEKKHIFLLFF